MADLTTIIEQSVQDASEGITEGVGTTTETPEVVETPVVEAAPAAAVAETKPAETDELTKELESQGIKSPVAGERENRIPYSRVLKILENSNKRLQQKLEEAHTLKIKEHTEKLTAAEKRVELANNLDRIATTDPERYLTLLASANPGYRKYLVQLTAEGASAATPKVADDAKPQPEKFADGSTGYSPEGLDKLLEWNARQVTAKVEKSYAERFGPMEQHWKAQRAQEQQIPIVNAQIDSARRTWGKPFDDHQSDILKTLQENDGQQGRPFLSFDAAVASVLVPKVQSKAQSERETMRAELLAEMAKRPGAAASSAPAATSTATVTPSGPRRLEDVIKEQIAASRLA